MLQSGRDTRARRASADSMQVGMKKKVGANAEFQIQRLLLINDADGASAPATEQTSKKFFSNLKNVVG